MRQQENQDATLVRRGVLINGLPWERPVRLTHGTHGTQVIIFADEEIQRALSKSSNSVAPGPDQIPYGVWKRVYSINLDILISLLNPLILYGFHPLSLKKANGVVLLKLGQPDYSSPSSFHILVLLETVSKILKPIIAN